MKNSYIYFYSLIGIMFVLPLQLQITHSSNLIYSPYIKQIDDIKFIELGDTLIFDNYVLILNVKNEIEGIEYQTKYIEEKNGKRNSDWILINQELIELNDRFFDKIQIQLLSTDKTITYHFDITRHFGIGTRLDPEKK